VTGFTPAGAARRYHRAVRVAWAALVVAGCGGSGGDGVDAGACQVDPPAAAPCGSSDATSVVVQMVDGDVPVAGGEAFTHLADGTELDRAETDAAGCARLARSDGALATVVFPSGTSAGDVVTASPPATGQLTVDGTRHLQPSLDDICAPTVVDYTVTTPAPAPVDGYLPVVHGASPWCRLGGTEPDTVLASRRCLNPDGTIDVLVVALRDSIMPPGGAVPYAWAGGRVPVVDGRATVVAGTWSQAGDPCPPLSDPPAPPRLACTFHVGNAAFAFDVPDLVVDRVTVVADSAAGQTTRLSYPGRPAQLALGTELFLPALSPTPMVVDAARLALQWPADGPPADLVVIGVEWSSRSFVGRWTVVLPAGATQVSFPPVALASLQLPDPVAPGPGDYTRVVRTYLDADLGGDYQQAIAAGLRTAPAADGATTPWLLPATTARIRLTSASGD